MVVASTNRQQGLTRWIKEAFLMKNRNSGLLINFYRLLKAFREDEVLLIANDSRIILTRTAQRFLMKAAADYSTHVSKTYLVRKKKRRATN
jgi:hypothetical protein